MASWARELRLHTLTTLLSPGDWGQKGQDPAVEHHAAKQRAGAFTDAGRCSLSSEMKGGLEGCGAGRFCFHVKQVNVGVSPERPPRQSFPAPSALAQHLPWAPSLSPQMWQPAALTTSTCASAPTRPPWAASSHPLPHWDMSPQSCGHTQPAGWGL